MRVPRLSVEMLAAVIAIAECKIRKHAADDLGITVSALGKRLDKASELLGISLFVSTEDGVVLTDAGLSFYSEARRAIEQALLAEAKVAALREIEAGRLVVGRSTYLPPRLLTAVLRLGFEESLGYQIIQVPGVTGLLADQVVKGVVHAGIGDLPISRPELISRVLQEECLVVCMPVKHPLACKAVIRPQDMAGEPIIAIGRDSSPALHEDIEQFFGGFGTQLRIVADAYGPPEAIVMVEQNLGICLLTNSDIFKPSVVGKRLVPQTLTRKWGLFVREDNRHPTLKAFMDLVLERIGKRH
jgi:DNA-binding transcriptional LysR family regulator